MSVVYTKNNCPNCIILKECLLKNNFNFTETKCTSLYDLTRDVCEDNEDRIIEIGSFPVVYYKGRFLGFSDALRMFDEPLIQENENRFNIYPIKHNDIFQM